LKLWDIALSSDLDGDVIEPSVSARALYRLQHFRAGTIGDLALPVITQSTTTNFNACVTIPFSDIRLIVPEDSIFDTRRYSNVVLTITSGVVADIITVSAGSITFGALTADIEIVRISPHSSSPVPMDLAKVLPFFKRYAPIAPAAVTTIDLDKNPRSAIKRLLSFASLSSTAGNPFTGTGSDAVVDTVLVSSNLRQHFGGQSGGVSRRTLRDANKTDYGVETWPTGWYVADFVLDGSVNSALAQGNKAQLQTIYAYQGSLGSVPQVTLLQDGIKQLHRVAVVGR
jgi:hypothetical protein